MAPRDRIQWSWTPQGLWAEVGRVVLKPDKRKHTGTVVEFLGHRATLLENAVMTYGMTLNQERFLIPEDGFDEFYWEHLTEWIVPGNPFDNVFEDMNRFGEIMAQKRRRNDDLGRGAGAA